jgi:hypothetical protein
MEIRQALEASGADVFLDAETVRGLLPELETKDDLRCTFSGVVALSYAWVTPADPDPERAQLAQLRPVLVWWMSERARRKRGYSGAGMFPDATMQTADFGVFIDFMSMFQPDDRTGFTYSVPTQQTSFGRALRNIGLLYGHRGSSVFKITKTPLPPEGDPQRVYEKRGWTHLERRLGDLEAPATNSLDVSVWPTAMLLMKSSDVRAASAVLRAGRTQLHESEEELAEQGDHYLIERPGMLGALIRGGRGAPVSPKHFEEELEEKVFSVDADRKTCAGLYRGVAEPLLADVEELKFEYLAWTEADWRHMGGTLACCPKLDYLDLSLMATTDAAMTAFGTAVERGAAPALKVLQFQRNEIGDEGLRHVADALARGAAPVLKVLKLCVNKIGGEGLRHLSDALARGAAPALETLDLGNNKIGDEGVRHLGDALARGAAPALKELNIVTNEIGDEGTHHLSDALARGAAPALERLYLNQNKIGDKGMRHLAEALARGAAPALKILHLYGIPGNKKVVEYALMHRALPEQLLDGAFLAARFADAKALDCGEFGWGVEEARRLAAALEHATAQGALKSLEVLDLNSNKIGDEGLRHVADALARGAAPALKDLTVWGNKIGDEGMRHLGSALARGAAPAL